MRLDRLKEKWLPYIAIITIYWAFEYCLPFSVFWGAFTLFGLGAGWAFVAAITLYGFVIYVDRVDDNEDYG